MTRPRTKEQFIQARKERKALKRIFRRRYKSVEIATVRNGQPVKRPVGRPRLPMGMLCPVCRNWKVEHRRGSKPPSWRCAYCQNKQRAERYRVKKQRRKRYLRKRAASAVKKSSARASTKQAQTVEPTPSQVPDTEGSIQI